MANQYGQEENITIFLPIDFINEQYREINNGGKIAHFFGKFFWIVSDKLFSSS